MVAIRRHMIWIAPLLAILIAAALSNTNMEGAAVACAGITVLCALWWIFESLPLPAVALLPFALFPLVGITNHRAVAGAYGDTIILLFLGGFFLSAAMERSGAHRRVAVYIIRVVGPGKKSMVFGFMMATAFLSMWISNTATTLMMVPIALAVLHDNHDPAWRNAMLLSIAFAASVGGMATPVGTPPNLLFMGAYQTITGEEFGFLNWMRIGLPISLVLLPIIWIWLVRNVVPGKALNLPDVGPWRAAEVRVLIIFLATAVAWVLREAPAGGWSQWLGLLDESGKPLVGDSTVALLAALALFVVPSGQETGERLLDWKTAEKIPWGILLLFAGGLALAQGFVASGLNMHIGSALQGVATLPKWPMLFVICIAVSFLTEITSSTATTALLLPILGSLASTAGFAPETLMIPATISASCAFMLPVATPPNAIVFAVGGIESGKMAVEGIGLNVVAAIVISTICYFFV